MIITEDLTKHFGQFVAVDGVHLEVGAGQVLALLGPNGAGKTTTVRMLTSILRPTRGKAQVAGYDVVQQPEKVRSVVGVLTEHHGLYNRMNALEYLDFYGQLYGLDRSLARRHSTELLAQFGLSLVHKKRLGEYSKGMRQKLALVRALLHNPPVLLLDEPTSAMDPESARVVRDAIGSLRSSERCIVLCTHNLSEAEELADQVAIIRHGRIFLQGTPEVLKQQLLGPVEFEARLSGDANGCKIDMPEGVRLTDSGPNWLRFRIENPETSNPELLRRLIEGELPVLSFHQVPRTLEQAYLAGVGRIEAEQVDV
jgi:ABC-2 type transport system ATP-binding protein